MMNSKFTDEQLRAYAAQFREGDAIWADGKWCETVVNRDFSHLSAKCSKNRFIVNYGGELFEGTTSGFNKTSPSQNRYRVTTLEHYELQGGEKIVWLGESDDFRTFGKVYKTENINNFTCDKGYMGWGVSGLYWGIIPRYEQVKNFGKEDDKMSEIKVVEESKYTGKFKAGNKVEVIAVTRFRDKWKSGLKNVGKRGFVIKMTDFIDDNITSYPYKVELEDDSQYWFNEAELELVSKRKDDSVDASRYVAKLYAEATSKLATHVSDSMFSMLKLSRTSDEVDRPASSHYHIDNNGNDVWQFADDNLSDERVKGFHQINAIKYVSRYNKKHDTKEKRIEDLEKAKVSIDKLIELEGLE